MLRFSDLILRASAALAAAVFISMAAYGNDKVEDDIFELIHVLRTLA